MARAAGCPVLVVEDDQDLRDMMVALLALEGFEPDGACDGADALAKLRAADTLPHVIVLDMMMPRMDGWEFCRQRAFDRMLRSVPVVVLSAAPRERINVTADAILSKPFDYDTLLRVIKTYC
jgi:DNA-binding response OmpR family regulator